MAVTPEDVRGIAPELKDRTDEDLERWIAIAERRVSRKAWGARADDGVTFLAAHLAIQGAKGSRAAAGPLSSVAVGQASQSYAVAADAGKHSATFYGRQFDEMAGLVFGCRAI